MLNLDLNKKFKKIHEILSLGITLGILITPHNQAGADSIPSQKNPNPQMRSLNSTKPTIKTFQGRLIYENIPPVMSVESYRGEEFFLITNSKDQNRLVLRHSEQVSHAQLQSFHNKQVSITAIYFKGTRPSSSQVNCPLDFDGACMSQGEGYQVLSVVSLNSGIIPFFQKL